MFLQFIYKIQQQVKVKLAGLFIYIDGIYFLKKSEMRRGKHIFDVRGIFNFLYIPKSEVTFLLYITNHP